MLIRKLLGVILVAVPVLVILVVAGLLFVHWTAGPPLRISHAADDQVVVDMQTLGEYPTVVSRIKITDSQTGLAVWEVIADEDPPEMHVFALVPGANPAQLKGRGGEYRVVTPSAPVFVLQGNHEYLIEVWGARANRSKASFSFHPSQV